MKADFAKAYLAAVKRDTDVRDAAFLGLTADICGVHIRQITIRDIIVLDGIGDNFLCGGPQSFRDAVRFLWMLSPSYRAGWFPAFRFGRRHRKIDEGKLISGIERFLEDTFQDAPGRKSGAAGPDFASFAAHLVHRLASAYCWPIDSIMGTHDKPGLPLKVIFQLLKCIRYKKEENPELRSRRILKVNGDRLREVNARNALQSERQKLVDLLAKRARN